MDYEQNLKKLEQISDELSNPSINLDEAVLKFEESLKIAKVAMENIKSAEGKIMVLKKELNEFVETQFAENNDN